MCLDISQTIPEDSIVTRKTLKKYKARSGSPGHLLLEVMSELNFDDALELQSRLSDNPNKHVEIWERYRERIGIMLEGKGEPTKEQKAQAMRDAVQPPEYPEGDAEAILRMISDMKKEPEAENTVEENQREVTTRMWDGVLAKAEARKKGEKNV